MAKKTSTKAEEAKKDTEATTPAVTPVDAVATDPGAKEGTAGQAPPPEKPVDADPLKTQQDELDIKLAALYDDLVVQIKAVTVKDVSTDSADQMRAGAVQFLRQCNATLLAAKEHLDNSKKVLEEDAKRVQEIEKSSKALEKRSEEYRRMTNPDTGEKNPQ